MVRGGVARAAAMNHKKNGARDGCPGWCAHSAATSAHVRGPSGMQDREKNSEYVLPGPIFCLLLSFVLSTRHARLVQGRETCLE